VSGYGNLELPFGLASGGGRLISLIGVFGGLGGASASLEIWSLLLPEEVVLLEESAGA
jgi:hypothetical protein